jgi:magnesium chelatase family protein
MLFKTLSASVYGIDAHLVLVEVDVGVGRMQDFNVVGLPDNAVKESRQRVQSALKNCGFEFPYGQGVTINLAPADLPRRVRRLICPWRWGWRVARGSFSGRSWTA